MFNSLKKVGVLSLAGVLVLTGCSFGSGKKANTMEPDQILTAAKKELFENAKASFKKSLENYEKDYVKGLTEWPSTGDFTFTLNVDAGANGKGSITLAENFKADMSGYKALTMDSTLLDLIKGAEGESSFELKVKAQVPPLSEMEGSVKFTILQDKGVYYLRLDDVVIPENIPGASVDEVKLVVDVYKGQWFKVDLAKVIEGNEMIAKFFKQTLRQLSNVDAQKLSKLMDGFIDEVVMKKDWMKLEKDSKADSDRGDRYKVVMEAASVREFLTTGYDFVEKNLEDIDAVIDFTQSRNPLYVSPTAITIAEVRTQMTSGRGDYVSALEKEEIPNMEFFATFSGDKLAVWSFEYDLSQNKTADAEGNLNLDWVFEDEKHDFELSHIDVKLDVKPKSEEGALSMTANINAPDGDDRGVKAEVEFVNESDGTFKGSLDTAANREDRTVSKFKMTFNLESKKELEEGTNGFDGKFDYSGGDDAELTGSVKSTPDGKLFDVSVDGEFGKEKGNSKLEFNVNFPGEETVKGDVGFDYDVAHKDVKFELPEGTDQAQDFTMVVEQAMSQAFGAPAMFMTPGMAPGMVDGEIPADVMMEGVPAGQIPTGLY